MLQNRQQFVLLLLVLASNSKQVFADAVVVTRAMTASTIAEIFVEENQIRVELEIGAPDLRAFRNILPDEVQEKLGTESQPLSTRLDTFFRNDFVLSVDDGEPLPGQVEHLVARKRVVRDEITGEPIPVQPGDAELVVAATLLYHLDRNPSELSIRPPLLNDDRSSAANIGFIAYHNGLPVNDFRYLASEATLELNWEDAWYSHFRNRNLQRQNAAPMSAFLYVEPFEVRKEVIVRPLDLQIFLDLGLDDQNVISVDQQAELKRKIGQFLDRRSPVLIDGQETEGRLDRIHFVRRTLRRTGIVDPPEDLDIMSATLGVIFVYPTPSLPQEVTLRWDLFNERIKEVPAVATDEAGPMPSTLTPQDPVLLWRNYLKHPTVPTFATISAPVVRKLSIPVVSLICVAALLPLGATLFHSHKSLGRASRRASLVWIAVAMIGAASFPYARLAVANPFATRPQLSDSEAQQILGGLLHNVYRAFDRRDQSLVYDQLSRSIAGDLLEQVYLQTRKSIEVENQGGLQITVKEVTIHDLERLAVDESELKYRCRWRVSGSVGHWGHVHSRVNEPSAEIAIAPIDGAWKITALEQQPIGE